MLDGSAILGLPVEQRRNLTTHDSILGFFMMHVPSEDQNTLLPTSMGW